jgi:hypothetical protein
MSISAMIKALEALESIKVTVSTATEVNVIDGIDLFPKQIAELRIGISDAEQRAKIRNIAPVQAIAEAEKQEPWVKTYCGGKPNYTKPEQEPVAWREVAGKTTHYYDYNEQGRGEPLYSAPVHAVDISQECADETAKYRHDLVYRLRKRAEIRRQIPDRKSVQEGQPDHIADLLEEAADALEKREWVGLTDDEIWDCYTSQGKQFYLAIEAKLKEKNT